MNRSRRRFLQTSTILGGAGLVTVGCRPATTLFARAADLGTGVMLPPSGTRVELVEHVLSRCTFGIAPGDRAQLADLADSPAEAIEVWLDRQLRPGDIEDGVSERVLRRFSAPSAPRAELYEYKKPFLLQELSESTVLRAVLSERQLFEVMVHFWTDHFNIDVSKGECAWLKAWDDREVIRRHALGRFGDLLRASALSPAMLWYLDGRINRRTRGGERPNENYARELLELHTMGVHGGYTQRDVMEVARCLTGWTVRSRERFRKAEVEFQPHLHDDGEKLVLGKRIPAGLGREDLDRVLDTLLGHPSTARFIARKLCRRFISDTPPASAVAAVAVTFTRTGGDIPSMLRTLFDQPEFRSPERFRTKLKRPFHYLISSLRATAATTDAGPELLAHLTAMGQALFQYPTPDGYPADAESWRNTLLPRWRLALALATNRIPGTRIDLEALMGQAGEPRRLLAHLLGRRPDEREWQACRTAGSQRLGLALALAAPGFQRF